MIYTFWEGKMPDYLKLCMKTWKLPYKVLTYDTLSNYTNLEVTENLKKFSLPQQADVVRVHVLRDNGGQWLDADTIMLDSTLPTETILGNNETRMNTIGYLNTTVRSTMFISWAEHQQRVLKNMPDFGWDVMGNRFTDRYLKENRGIAIGDITPHWAETYMKTGDTSRYSKYREFYFSDSYGLSDLRPTNLIMLHNSWTPSWYKQLSEKEVLEQDCTLSNILREVCR